MVYLFIMGKSIGESDVNFISDSLFIIFVFIVLVRMVVPGEQRVVASQMSLCLGLFCSRIFSLSFCTVLRRRRKRLCYGGILHSLVDDDVVVHFGS